MSVVTIPLSGFVSEIFSPKVGIMIIIRDDVISDVIRPGATTVGTIWNVDTPCREHCVQVSFNSVKNCRKRVQFKENS